jgi:hypothetical protein
MASVHAERLRRAQELHLPNRGCVDVNATGTPPRLRPLGLGEVLDRAVTLCVKHFVPFATINLVYAIPLAVVTYFATKNFQTVLQSLTDLVQHGEASGRPASQFEISRAFSTGHGLDGWSVLSFAMLLLVAPLPVAALIDATASSYLGRLPTFAQAYRVGFARWLPLVGINLLYLVAAVLLYVVLTLLLVFVIFGLAFLTSALHAVGIAIDIVIGIVMFVFALAFGVVAALAWQISFFTCVVEGAPAVTSFRQGLSRVFVGVGLKRSLLIGLAFVAIGLAVTIVDVVGQSILVGLLRSAVAGTVYATIVRVATAAFTTAFIAIFYFDLRVREEGLDLTLAAQSARAGSLEAT